MQKKFRPMIAFAGFLSVLAVAAAKDEVANPHWFSKSQVASIEAAEPPPPAPGSAEDKADLQAEIDAQTNRSPDAKQEAEIDASYSVMLFSAGMGPDVTPANDPVLFHFFDRFNKQVGQIVTDLKNKWKRPRPYLGHPEVIHALFGASGYSYPSGHATHSYAFAVILGQLFPDKEDAFLGRARLIAQSRVDAGVHYETDIKEGERLGKEIAKDLLSNPEFVAELDAAKAELAGKK
jgi:hypothetical protein